MSNVENPSQVQKRKPNQSLRMRTQHQHDSDCSWLFLSCPADPNRESSQHYLKTSSGRRSLPARVDSARQTPMCTLFDTERTEPSIMETLTEGPKKLRAVTAA